MAVVNDTGLSSQAIIGRFYRRLEEHADSAWWTNLAMQFSSSGDSETYRWLGMVPQVREWIGGRHVKALATQGITIANKTWESTIRVDADEQRRDQSGQILVRVNEMARRVAMHPNKLITDLVQNGATNPCYDGTPFFSQTHADDGAGVQSNIETVDVASPMAPTVEEMYNAILAGITRMLMVRDEADEPINESAQEFIVMVPMPFFAQTLAAVNGSPSEAITNPLGNGPLRVKWITNSRLIWLDRFAIFRGDGDTRPFIFQEELPVQVHALAEGSELEVNENQHQYGVKAIHAAGYGFWQSACQVVLS